MHRRRAAHQTVFENMPFKWLRQNFLAKNFFLYLLIGAIVFCVDMGSFLGFIYISKLYRPLSACIAFLLGLACHFSLNKYFNFKSFERLMHQQVQTYLLVVGTNLLVTVLVIELMCDSFHVPPFYAKLSAIAVNVPIGFLGHKYLTFGNGVRGFLSARIRSFWKLENE